MDWFIKCIRQYAVFQGRANRIEYWMFGLVSLIASALLTVIDAIIGRLDFDAGVGLFSGLFGVVMVLPTLAVSVRRLHDTGRSAWWLLVAFVPIAGLLLLLVFALLPGQRGLNAYGPVPPSHA